MSIIDTSFPFPKIIPFHSPPKNWFSHKTNRVATIALHRLRSGHNRLNGHQSKYNPVLPFCRRGCREKEDAEHVLIKCPALDEYRVKLKQLVQKYNIPLNVQTILGCNFDLRNNLQIIVRNAVLSLLKSSNYIQEI